jgi:ABC-2 type transport system ATP-binding protein
MWRFVSEINRAGTTVILTTLYLEEAENLCNNVAIIDHGDIVENTSIKTLLGKLKVETFVLDLREPIDTPPEVDGIEIIQRGPTTLEASIPKSRSLNRLFRVLEEQGVDVISMRNKANRLEELFMRLFGIDEEAA